MNEKVAWYKVGAKSGPKERQEPVHGEGRPEDEM